jgi:hypothetical protein
MTNSTQAETKFFDLHTRGIGYVSRIREVKPRKGDSFTSCTVAALCGSSDSIEYRYIDTKVVGAEALKLVLRCQQAVSENRKVLVSFNIGDIWVDPFTYKTGPKAGTQGFSLKGRLLAIDWIKVDGEIAYSKPEANANANAEAAYDGFESFALNDEEYTITCAEESDEDRSAMLSQLPKLNNTFDNLVTD